ncbi:MAG TPA: hypothetical protein VFD58_19610 [Blastocatellia bacterium]|nr:hypothetical protein [Blastocatellia bacterium]
MFRHHRFFASAALIAALIIQSFPVAARRGNVTGTEPGQLQAADEASVKITDLALRSALPGGGVPRAASSPDEAGGGAGFIQRVEVIWQAGVPKGVTLLGFDISVVADLNNGQSLSASRSVGGNVRTADFNFQLPAGGNGGGNTANGGGGNAAECKGFDCSLCGKKNPLALCATCCNNPGGNNTGGKGDLNNGGGGNTGGKGGFNGGDRGGINNGGNDSGGKAASCETKCRGKFKVGPGLQKCIEECQATSVKPKTPPRKSNFLTNNFAPGTSFINGAAPQKEKEGIKGGIIERLIRIGGVTASVTARFSRGAEVTALRGFLPPAAIPSGELAFDPNRLREAGNLRILKLIEIAKVPSLAKECPAGLDCFDVVAELRGDNSSGSPIKVSLEALYSNNQRRDAARLVNLLARPVRLSVERPTGATFTSVVVTINGVVAEAFTRSDQERRTFITLK